MEYGHTGCMGLQGIIFVEERVVIVVQCHRREEVK